MKHLQGFVKAIDEEKYSVTAVISTAAVDAANDVLIPKACNLSKFLSNPVVLFEHGKYHLPIGTARNPDTGLIDILVEDDKIIATTHFDRESEFAMDVYRMYKAGLLNTWSVGGVANKHQMERRDGKQVRVVYSWDLVEYSAVTVPSNHEAITKIVKSGLIGDQQLSKSFTQLYNVGMNLTKGKPVTHSKKASVQWLQMLRDCAGEILMSLSELDHETTLEVGKDLVKYLAGAEDILAAVIPDMPERPTDDSLIEAAIMRRENDPEYVDDTTVVIESYTPKHFTVLTPAPTTAKIDILAKYQDRKKKKLEQEDLQKQLVTSLHEVNGMLKSLTGSK